MIFEPGKTIETTTPTVEVDGTLPVGIHRFRLVVENARGQRSAPSEVSIAIVRETSGGGIVVGPVRPGIIVDPGRVTPVLPVTPITPILPIPPRPRAPRTRNRKQRPPQ